MIPFLFFIAIVILGATSSTYLATAYPQRAELINYVIGMLVGLSTARLWWH